MDIFLLVAGIHFFAVIAPGPAFIAIFNHALREQNFKNVFRFILGIALGDAVIIGISISSLSDVIISNKICNLVIHIIGAGFLFWIGCLIFKTKNIDRNEKKIFASTVKGGFLFTMANPKAILFYIGLFTMVIGVETVFLVKFLYAFWIIFATIIYFSALGFIFFLIKEKVLPYIVTLSKIFGIGICSFAVLILQKGFAAFFL